MADIKILKEKLQGIKVLFVDDEEDIRKGTGAFLEKFFDNVIICSDGQEGLNIFKENSDIKIVITDVMMPKMSGPEMVHQITKINPDVFIVYISASRGAEYEKETARSIYVKKPLSYDDMKYILQKIEEIV